MSRSFVVGKRNSRAVFGRACADAAIREVSPMVMERKSNRQNTFIEQQERSEQSAVERIGCNSDFIPPNRMRRNRELDSKKNVKREEWRKGWDSNPRLFRGTSEKSLPQV